MQRKARRLRCEEEAEQDQAQETTPQVTEEQAYTEETMVVWHLNVRGWRSKEAEVTALVRLAKTKPHVLCLNETFLDRGVAELKLEGYEEVARKDREDGWGGVAVLAKKEITNNVVHLDTSSSAERVWLILHTDQGPYFLCSSYRPPARGNTDSI